METPNGLEYMDLKIGDFVETDKLFRQKIRGRIGEFIVSKNETQWGCKHRIAMINIGNYQYVGVRDSFLLLSEPETDLEKHNPTFKVVVSGKYV